MTTPEVEALQRKAQRAFATHSRLKDMATVLADDLGFDAAVVERITARAWRAAEIGVAAERAADELAEFGEYDPELEARLDDALAQGD